MKIKLGISALCILFIIILLEACPTTDADTLSYRTDITADQHRLYQQRNQTNNTSSVKGTSDYESYGKPTGTLKTTTPTSFGYNGELQDPDTHSVYLRARDYDPGLQRFLTMDSANVWNKYNFADANPMMMIDPSGHIALLTVIAIAGFVMMMIPGEQPEAGEQPEGAALATVAEGAEAVVETTEVAEGAAETAEVASGSTKAAMGAVEAADATESVTAAADVNNVAAELGQEAEAVGNGEATASSPDLALDPWAQDIDQIPTKAVTDADGIEPEDEFALRREVPILPEVRPDPEIERAIEQGLPNFRLLSGRKLENIIPLYQWNKVRLASRPLVGDVSPIILKKLESEPEYIGQDISLSFANQAGGPIEPTESLIHFAGQEITIVLNP